LTEPNNLIGDTTWMMDPLSISSPRRQKASHHGLLSHGQVLSLDQSNYWYGRKQKPGDRAAWALGQSQWLVLLHCFQNCHIIESGMKPRTKQPQDCKVSFCYFQG